MNGYFVTGTDTNVGKTYVTCAMARRAVARGLKVFAFKPIESGCLLGAAGELIGADQELLVAAAGSWQQGALRGLYRFQLPAAPLVAAQAASATIDLSLVVGTARQGAMENQAALTLVEGAGGWRVPITPKADMSTLARELALPVVIVARASLGTINHTLLTMEAVQRDGLPLAAIVISQKPDDDPEAAQSNRAQISQHWPGLVLTLGSAPSVLDGLLETPKRST